MGRVSILLLLSCSLMMGCGSGHRGLSIGSSDNGPTDLENSNSSSGSFDNRFSEIFFQDSEPANELETVGNSEAVSLEKCGSAVACAMQAKINSIRVANNRSPLGASGPCQQMAQAHAEEMARNNYLSHTDSRGEGPSARIQGYGGAFAGENIAVGPNNIALIADLWMGSSGHRQNILGNYGRTGVGAAQNSRGDTYWVQCFTN